MQRKYNKSQVIGIDVGSQDSIIQYVGKAQVDIVQNEVSQRKTPSMVGFNDQQRLCGDSQHVIMKSNQKNTCRNFKYFVGASDSEGMEESKQIEKFWELQKLEEKDGEFGFQVEYLGEPKFFSQTQVMQMYLTKLKETQETWCEQNVHDIVLQIPSYFDDKKRKQMLDQQDIQNLHCLRLMNESTQTQLSYGIYRVKEFDQEKPTYVQFGQLGHSSFSQSIYQFTNTKVTLVQEQTTQKQGGRYIDQFLMKHFQQEFEKKYGCNPLENKKQRIKLEDQCTKCKKILSQNDRQPIGVECLMEDEDLSGIMYRNTQEDGKIGLDDLCKPMQEEVQNTIQKQLDKQLRNQQTPQGSLQLDSLKDLSYVEIVGGQSRVPWFQDVMKEKFQVEDLSKTLNQDECVQRGCQLQQQMLSPLYKVREFKVVDKVTKSVSIHWNSYSQQDEDEEGQKPKMERKTMVVFEEGKDKLDMSKYVTWKRQEDFTVQVGYTENTGTQKECELGEFQISMQKQAEKKKVKLEQHMNIHGIFGIKKSEMYDQEEITEIIKEKRKKTQQTQQQEGSGEVPVQKDNQDQTGQQGEEKADETMKDQEKDDSDKDKKDEDSQQKKDKEDTEMKDQEASGSDKKEEEEFEWVEVEKKKMKQVKTNLKIKNMQSLTRLQQDEKLMQEQRDIETQLQQTQNQVQENSDRRNDLETFIYKQRSEFESGGKYQDYIEKKDQEKLVEELQKQDDWLYDHYDQTTVELVEKLQQLREFSQPSEKRWKIRDDVKNYEVQFSTDLSNQRNLMNSFNEENEHISEEKRKPQLEKLKEVEVWLQTEQEKDQKKDKFLDCDFSAQDMHKRLVEQLDVCKKIMQEPKPQPVKEEETDVKEDVQMEGQHQESEKTGEEQEKTEQTKDQEQEKKENTDSEMKQDQAKEAEPVNNGDCQMDVDDQAAAKQETEKQEPSTGQEDQEEQQQQI